MTINSNRREFLRDMGLGAAALPFLCNLPSLQAAGTAGKKKQRLVVIFTPNGVIPKNFWPAEEGEKFTLPECLKPLAAYQSKMLSLYGVCDKVRGDGDNHMRGIGCLLTGVELFPGNIQGGSHTPAGWASGMSIDQEIRTHLQKDAATRTRFGSLEFGVMVPERADTWTRMVYTGPNKPVAPVDDPYRMFNKLYGKAKDRALVGSVLDDVKGDLKKLSGTLGTEDRRLLEEHAGYVRDMEQDLRAASDELKNHRVPDLEPGVRRDNDNMPKLSRLQIDLMVNSFAADFTRIATFQYTNSVGMAKMRWIGVSEGHHELSHEPDTNAAAVEKLTKINTWFAGEIAYLCKRLADTPEPGGQGSMLDNTLIVWTNELGKGNSHTLDNTPFLLLGGAPGFKMGRSLKLPKVPHNRLLMSFAHAFGHRITKFGNPDFCSGGPLSLS